MLKNRLKQKQQTEFCFIRLTLYNDEINSTKCVHNISYWLYKLLNMITKS